MKKPDYTVSTPSGNYRKKSKTLIQKMLVNSPFWLNVGGDILYIIVPAVLSLYFVGHFDDRIVVGVGVGFGIYSLYKLATLAYLARSNAR